MHWKLAVPGFVSLINLCGSILGKQGQKGAVDQLCISRAGVGFPRAVEQLSVNRRTDASPGHATSMAYLWHAYKQWGPNKTQNEREARPNTGQPG